MCQTLGQARRQLWSRMKPVIHPGSHKAYSLIERLGHIGEITLNYANHVCWVPIILCKVNKHFRRELFLAEKIRGHLCWCCSSSFWHLWVVFFQLDWPWVRVREVFCVTTIHIYGCESLQLKSHQTMLNPFYLIFYSILLYSTKILPYEKQHRLQTQ